MISNQIVSRETLISNTFVIVTQLSIIVSRETLFIICNEFQEYIVSRETIVLMNLINCN